MRSAHYVCIAMLIQMFLMRKTLGTGVGLLWASAQASLSPHRALISLPPACLSSASSPIQRQWLPHELCGRIDQVIENHCLEPWVIIEGGITQLLFCACAWGSVLLSSLSLHVLLSSSEIRSAHTYTYSSQHNQHGPNDCLHWLPPLRNYVPIVYFLASYSFKRNSIIIALFNVKVSKSGGSGAPVAILSLSVSMTPPLLLGFHRPT